MPQAALPAIMGGGALLGALGKGMAARGRGIQTIDAPPPVAVFPEAQKQFFGQFLGPGGYGTNSIDTLNQAVKTGLPTSFASDGSLSDIGPMMNAIRAARARSTSEGAANILEQYGSTGMRYGSAPLNALVDYQGQIEKDYGALVGQYAFQALEAAKGRQFQAQENAATRQMGAALPAAETYGNAAMAMRPSAYLYQPGGGSWLSTIMQGAGAGMSAYGASGGKPSGGGNGGPK